MDRSVLVLSLLSLLCSGVCQFASKPSVDRIGWWNTGMVWNALQFMMLLPIWLWLRQVSVQPEIVRPVWSGPGWVWCTIAAITGTAGGLFYNMAIVRPNSVSLAVVVSSLYPMVTVALAVIFLKERLTTLQWVGSGLAICSLLCMAWPAKR